MIRSFAFKQGRLHSQDIDAFLMPTLLMDTDLFLWVDLDCPSEEESRLILDQVFHFHPLSIDDCVIESSTPKVEIYTPREEDRFAPYLFLVIHAVDYSRRDGVFATSELNFFLGRNLLVTYHTHPLRPVNMTAERCLQQKTRMAKAPDRVACNLLDAIVENYKPALDELSIEVAELEEQVLQSQTAEVLNKIVQVKKEVHHLQRIISPQREVLAQFARGDFKIIRPKMVPYFRNVYDGLFYISELAKHHTDSLTAILQIYLNLSSNKTAEIVKLLTIITVITTPVSLVGTWYGMNFEGMQELSWPFSYIAVLGVTVLATGATYWYFKRKKWL